AVGVASVHAEQPHAAARAQSSGAQRATATRILDGSAVTAEEAAYANATLFHARCQEDAHPAGHFGAVVLPAALAVAEATSSSGADLLVAIVAGYETALRIGRDHVVDLSARGFRSTSAYGVFGAAAAAARLRRLDAERTAHALAIAANAACGLRAFVAAGSDEYAFHAAFAAQNGLMAAALAANGADGPLDVLESDAGFFAAFGTAGCDYSKRIAEGLGEQFEMERVTFKPYPTCQFHRAFIAGLMRLRAQAGTTPASSIEIRMHPVEADFWGVRFTGPFRRFSQAFMSAPFCAAVAWIRGNVRFADLHDFDDPDVQALVERVFIVSDPRRERYRPSLHVT
ncbi:MAG: MmgE/PrpD family protein, partial [Polyangiaceae bacterium]